MSTNRIPRKTISRRPAARGVAMIVVLMLLLAVTGIAVFSAKNASFGETSARNQLDSELARQAAESALRDAERDLLLDGGVAVINAKCSRGEGRPLEPDGYRKFSSTCAQGQCVLLPAAYISSTWTTGSTAAEPWWPVSKGGLWGNDPTAKPTAVGVNCTFNGGVPIGTYTGTAAIPGVAAQPEYLIERFERGAKRNTFYRITARGFGLSESTQVVLQTYFRPQY